MKYVSLYILAIIAANLIAARFGPAVTPLVGFFLIGLNLVLRDKLHDLWQGRSLWLKMLSLITVSGLLSYWFNPASGMIAVASVVAFCAASLADAAGYQALSRRSWGVRANGSNIGGAAVDSVIFPLVAFGAFMPEIVVGQFIAKVAGGALWVALLGRRGNLRTMAK